MATAPRYVDYSERLADIVDASRDVAECDAELRELRGRLHRLIGELHGTAPVEIIAAAAGMTRESVHRIVRRERGR